MPCYINVVVLCLSVLSKHLKINGWKMIWKMNLLLGINALSVPGRVYSDGIVDWIRVVWVISVVHWGVDSIIGVLA